MIARAIATISASRSPSGAAELRSANLRGSPQCKQRDAGTTRLDRDHPLAPAEREAPKPDDACLSHRGANHPQRLLRDGAIRVEVIRRGSLMRTRLP
jgi:hypothetical protein